jgi:phosphate-selective porin OprO and OprP
MTPVKILLVILASALSTLAMAQSVLTEGNDLVINANGPLSVETANGDYSIKLGGRIHWDYNRAEQNDVVDEDAFDIRRARLYISGDIQDWGYKLQFNVGNGNGGTPEDVYIRYNGLSNGMRVTVGRQKEPFGLNQLNSSNDIVFLERSASDEAYAPARSDGVQLDLRSGNTVYALGVFEDDADTSTFALTGRVASAVVREDDLLVHLGLAHTARGADISSSAFEAALVSGSLHLQGEYYSSDNAGTDLNSHYLQAGWFLTGDSRPYSNGTFGRVKPNQSSGAWEIAVRYESGDGNYADIELGNTDATSVGVAVNWYINDFSRFGIDYTTGEDNNSNDTGSEIRARLQVAL